MDERHDLGRVIDVIREVGPDVVCLQEVDQNLSRSGNIDQADVIADRLGMQAVFQGNLRMERGLYGIAVLAALPVSRVVNHRLTSYTEPRGALEVGISRENVDLTVICLHLGLDAEERLQQAEEVAEIVCGLSGAVVVCGDFNEENDCAGVSRLIERARFSDAYPAGPPTFDSANPSNRIDLLLLSSGINVLGAAVIDTQASDHLPLVVEIDL